MFSSWSSIHFLLLNFFCLTVAVGMKSPLMTSTYFQSVLWPNGTSVCALDAPFENSVASSVVSCSDACKKSSTCGNFNYDSTSKACGTYKTRPSCYGYVSPSCYHYELQSYPNKPDTGIPPEECRIPFTYELKLYESCALNLTGDGCMNCLGSSWTIVRCQQPPNFYPKSVKVMISVPTFASSIPALSINSWIVFLYRYDGSLDFARSWKDYKDGFGNPPGEYWLGLEKLHQLTYSGHYRARFEIQSLENGSWYSAEYDNILIDPESNWYTIHVSGYHGDSGDLFEFPFSAAGFQNGMNFTTYDNGNDNCNYAYVSNCANKTKGYGGWWYNCCCSQALTNPPGHAAYFWGYLKAVGWEKDARLNGTRAMIKRV